jgi:hypothetical protein
MCFLVSWWWDRGSIVFPSAAYSRGAGFYPLFHLGQGSLAIKTATVVKLQSWNYCNPSWKSVIATVPVSWFSIRERIYIHGPERLKIVGGVLGGRQRKALVGYMRWEIYVAVGDGNLGIRKGWLQRLGCDEESQ